MPLMSCVDAVSYVVDDATNVFGKTLKLSKKNKTFLLELCSKLDKMIEGFPIEEFFARVDYDTTDIEVTIKSYVFVIDEVTCDFYDVVKWAKIVKFSASGGYGFVRLVFPGVWS